MHIDDQTYQRNGKTYRRALLRNSYRKDGKVIHDTIANLSMCSEEEIEVMKSFSWRMMDHKFDDQYWLFSCRFILKVSSLKKIWNHVWTFESI